MNLDARMNVNFAHAEARHAMRHIKLALEGAKDDPDFGDDLYECANAVDEAHAKLTNLLNHIYFKRGPSK